MIRNVFLMVCLGILAACASSDPKPARIAGDPVALATLIGSWSGHYESGATGRSGSIVFNLTSEDAGYGDVVMTPVPWVHVSRPDDLTVSLDHPSTMEPASIEITEVRLERGVISGELAIYRDPASGALLNTSFRGVLEGEQIRGTFAIHSPDRMIPLEGTWLVRRESGPTQPVRSGTEGSFEHR